MVRSLKCHGLYTGKTYSFSYPHRDVWPTVSLLANVVFTVYFPRCQRYHSGRSSQREPTQIFMLLQTLYHSFDEIASKSKVYKVETIGDCYMAATGLPKPQSDHHIRMARFARAIMESMTDITKKFDIILGK